MSSVKIGHKILEYRKMHGLTIRDFAAKTNLSPSLLSQLERGIGNPSLNALKSIASVMGVSLSTLFYQEIDTESLILRKSQRTITYNPEKTHITYNTLTPDPTKSNIELFLAILKPHSETAGDLVWHTGEEIAMILDGEAEATIEGESFTLYEGDTIRILPEHKHKFANQTEQDLQILFVRAAHN
jgi:transcriptional regulator with XRE-family HTH domain